MRVAASQIVQFAEPPILFDWALAFTRPENIAAFAYWDSLRAGRVMPTRQELSPRAMKAFLTHVNLVELCGDGYAVELQGAHGASVIGPLTRRPLDAVLSPMTARRLRECLNAVKESVRPVRISSRVTAGDKLWLDAECLLAPLGGQTIRSILWTFVSWNDEDSAA